MPSARLTVSLQLGILSLLSAFLLFQVQPVISKFILPWFGGGPGVWTTCMLFFQVVLFAGYAYAHALTRLPHRWQGIIHGVLILAAAATLPIAPGEQWKPVGLVDPAGRILLLLLANVALPYFALSSTSPLVQVWFSRSGEGRSPWRLYALSNIGSLAALLTYPFLIEPRWDVMQQTWIWSGGFIVFGILSFAGAFADRKRIVNAEPIAAADNGAVSTSGEALWWRRILWVLLPAVASVLLLASTNHLCQDVAVIPFLWVLPLSLYLLSFIICFEHERWYARVVWALPAMALLLAAGTHGDIKNWLHRMQENPSFTWLPGDLTPNFKWEIALGCSAMFFGCMVCHGELARLKPAPKRLTEFYLLMSAGGALGGLFVSLAAPNLFTTFVEWPWVLVACFGIAALALFQSAWKQRRIGLRVALMVVIAALAIPGMLYFRNAAFEVKDRIVSVRNFYGVVSVKEENASDTSGMRTLFHGDIVHGYQYLDVNTRNEAMSYYWADTGIGRALQTLKGRADARVGIVGMGTATVASYGEKGQTYRFYDINPEIVKLAREKFYFLSDLEARGGTVEVAMGDARRSLETEPAQRFDVLLLDAFSGDSVPVHLLTREAFQMYQRHMKPDGIIAVHVSSRYLTLTPVVEKVAASVGWKTTRIATEEDGYNESTDYVMVTNNEEFLQENPIGVEWEGMFPSVILWTDKSNNLFEILKK
ncbi:MAG: fused MFS/spermidine synthase [Planctomycetota bacterium]